MADFSEEYLELVFDCNALHKALRNSLQLFRKTGSVGKKTGCWRTSKRTANIYRSQSSPFQ